MVEPPYYRKISVFERSESAANLLNRPLQEILTVGIDIDVPRGGDGMGASGYFRLIRLKRTWIVTGGLKTTFDTDKVSIRRSRGSGFQPPTNHRGTAESATFSSSKYVVIQ